MTTNPQASNGQTVAVWGTFDLLHKGHIAFLEGAHDYGSVYVLVIPDDAVLQNKGHLPVHSANARRRNILKHVPFVSSCYIDSFQRGLPSLIDLRPDYFCIGYDQSPEWEQKLKQFFSKENLDTTVIRLPSSHVTLHSSDIRSKAS